MKQFTEYKSSGSHDPAAPWIVKVSVREPQRDFGLPEMRPYIAGEKGEALGEILSAMPQDVVMEAINSWFWTAGTDIEIEVLRRVGASERSIGKETVINSIPVKNGTDRLRLSRK